jgi:prevent-host-death family protein
VASYNVHQAKTQLSRLLDLVLQGEAVVITRNGRPVAELVPPRKRPFPIGLGQNDPDVNPEALDSDEWWRPMTDEEVEDFIEGRY